MGKNSSELSIAATYVTEKAAIAAFGMLDQKNEQEADRLATEAMREALNELKVDGRIIIGEGERDNAPMLYIGEKLGKGGDEIDIAVDPLEGTGLLANNKPGALSVIAFAPKGELLNAPDIYMDKIAIGIDFEERLIDLNNSLLENLKNLASAKKCNISDLVVTILNRPRHEELIAKVKEIGTRVRLIDDGDVAAIIETSNLFYLSDIYIGIGGAPEGVLAAAALQNMGGQMCAKLIFESKQEKERAAKMGIKDYSKQYYLDDLASKDAIFSATGVTNCSMIEGIKVAENEYITNSLVMYNKTIKKFKTCINILIQV